MHSKKLFALAVALPVALSLNACSAARDVEINGTVTADELQGQIFVEVYDVRDDQSELVHTFTVGDSKTFRVNVPVEGDKVLVRAVDDADANEACSEGEQWWEVAATIEHGEVPRLGFPLRVAPCPE